MTVMTYSKYKSRWAIVIATHSDAEEIQVPSFVVCFFASNRYEWWEGPNRQRWYVMPNQLLWRLRRGRLGMQKPKSHPPSEFVDEMPEGNANQERVRLKGRDKADAF